MCGRFEGVYRLISNNDITLDEALTDMGISLDQKRYYLEWEEYIK